MRGMRGMRGDAMGTRRGNFLKEVSPDPFKNFQRIYWESANIVPPVFGRGDIMPCMSAGIPPSGFD